MALSDDGYLAVLLTGYLSGKWHDQLLLYQLGTTSGVYDAPKLVGVSSRIETSGTSSSYPGAVLGMRKSGSAREVIFSTPDSIRTWSVTPASPPGGGTLKEIFKASSDSTMVDASMDAMGSSKVAIIAGNSVIIKDVDDTSAQGVSVSVQMLSSTTLDRLVGARVGLSGSLLAIATPYGATNTFSLYQVGGDAVSLVAGTKLSRFFDVKVFRFFPNYLLASSQAGGIEIYDLSQ
jgi:hypothetical protein